MKTTLTLLSAALLAPATIVAGLATPVAFGITAVLGLGSIVLADYGKHCPSYAATPAAVKRTECHPLAA